MSIKEYASKSGGLPPGSFPLLVASTAFLAVYASGIIIRPGELYLRIQSNVVYNLPGLVALVLVLRQTRDSDHRQAWGWRLMAISLVCWQIGDWLFTFYDLVLGQEPPFPGAADIFYSLGYAPLLLAIPLLTYPRRRLGGLRWILDASLITMVAGFFQWELILTPILHNAEATLGESLLALSYPLWDLCLLGIIVGGLLARHGQLPLRAGMLLAAMSFMAITDTLYSFDVVGEGYKNVGNPLELGWLATYLFIGLAATLPGKEEMERQVTRLPFYALVFPYLLAMPLPVVQAIRSVTRDDLDVLSLGGALVLLIAFLSHVHTSYLTMRAMDEEQRKARFDNLTGALNRGAIVAEVESMIEHSGHFVLGLIDVDSLKWINDQFGHTMGDQALRLIANQLRRTGGIIGRYGGDEFLVVLELLGQSAHEEAESLIAGALDGAVLHGAGEGELRVTASFGIAMYPDQALNFVSLFAVADNTMYGQKETRAKRTPLTVGSTNSSASQTT
jgi:diguanylate cyclase (GGDEF)-like protein